MLIQKVYTWYVSVSWVLWTAVMVVTKINGNVYDIKNQVVFDIVELLSGLLFLISLVPIIPIMCLLSVIISLKNKKYSYLIFDLLSIPASVYIWFLFMVTVTVSIGGGV